MPRSPRQILSVLLVEGPTERLFYERVKHTYLDCPCRIEEMEGLFNINKKILHALSTKNRTHQVRAYCCLDSESRYSKTPGLDLKFVRSELMRAGILNVLSIEGIIARQMIESWFFYDIAGIYRYLRVPRSQRRLNAYRPVERYRVENLKKLFRRYGKVYTEGERARGLIQSLDLPCIINQCAALRRGIERIELRS